MNTLNVRKLIGDEKNPIVKVENRAKNFMIEKVEKILGHDHDKRTPACPKDRKGSDTSANNLKRACGCAVWPWSIIAIFTSFC